MTAEQKIKLMIKLIDDFYQCSFTEAEAYMTLLEILTTIMEYKEEIEDA